MIATFASDANQRIQRQAISALTAIFEGIPALIQLAKNAPDTALRKQAMNSLQSSQDPRAERFFEDLLKR